MKHLTLRSFQRTLLLSGLAISTTVSAATYNWQGDNGADFTDGANWVENTWSQWDHYRFGADVVSGAVNINGFFGIGSLTLQSGLTQDIVITSSNPQPVIMNTDFAADNLASISIASDSRDLTINGEYISSSPVTWNVGAGRTLAMAGLLKDWFESAGPGQAGGGQRGPFRRQ
jgi:hypothetical protein